MKVDQQRHTQRAEDYFKGWYLANQIRDLFEKGQKQGDYKYLFKNILEKTNYSGIH